MVGTGLIPLWGFTPARNLADHLPPTAANEPATIGVVEAGGPHHLLRTLAWAQTTHQLTLVAVETRPELIARQLLLLAVATDAGVEIDDRAEYFLELYGNTLLRDTTAAYYVGLCATLAEYAADPATSQNLQVESFVDLSVLKHKDRDALEAVFKEWASPAECDIATYWDDRLRAYYTERYGVRDNLADWDYYMKLAHLTTAVVPERFMSWRRDGIAYTYTDNANTPNTSLVCYSEVYGTRKRVRRGYWGDIVSSPYVALGGVREDGVVADKPSREYNETTNAVDNLVCWMSALDARLADSATTVPKLRYLLGDFSTLAGRAALKGKLHTCVFSTVSIQNSQGPGGAALSPGATVVYETARFILEFDITDRCAVTSRAVEVGVAEGWVCETQLSQAVLDVSKPDNESEASSGNTKGKASAEWEDEESTPADPPTDTDNNNNTTTTTTTDNNNNNNTDDDNNNNNNNNNSTQSEEGESERGHANYNPRPRRQVAGEEMPDYLVFSVPA